MSPLIVLSLVGLLTGVLTGMFGIGGGALMVPAMMFFLGLDLKQAAGTSLAAQVLPIGLLGSIVYYRSGQLNVQYAVVLALGLTLGNVVGALFTTQAFVSVETMRRMFGLLLVIVGVRFLLTR